MSWTLFKMTMRKNWPLLLIFFAVIAMYITVMISMYNPDDEKLLASMLEMFPEELMNAMGFGDVVNGLTEYLASWLYGMLVFAFPMVYCIILGNRLVAKMVDNSSFAYLLSTPNSRAKIILTQGVYALTSIFILFIALFGLGVVASEISFPKLLDINGFLKLNLMTMLLNMLAMMICFFFSCLFNETRFSLGSGGGFLIISFLMNMLGSANEKLVVLKKLSIYGLYEPVGIIRGEPYIAIYFLYFAFSLLLFIAGVLIFNRKNLPL